MEERERDWETYQKDERLIFSDVSVACWQWRIGDGERVEMLAVAKG